jgi:hypothetical protein
LHPHIFLICFTYSTLLFMFSRSHNHSRCMVLSSCILFLQCVFTCKTCEALPPPRGCIASIATLLPLPPLPPLSQILLLVTLIFPSFSDEHGNAFYCICLGRAGSEREGPQERPAKHRKQIVKQSGPTSSKKWSNIVQQLVKHRQTT